METLSFYQDKYPGILNVAVGDTIHNIIGDYLVSTVDSVSQPNITTITTTYNSGPQVTVNLFSFAQTTATGGLWQFGTAGNLTLPDGGYIDNNGGITRLGAAGNLGAQIGSADTQNYVTASNVGVTVQTLADSTNSNWLFDLSGNLILPTGGVVTASDANVHIAGNVVLGSHGNIVFSDSTVQTTAYQVVKSAWNTQYPSVRMGNALFNLDNAGNPTVGAVSGTWTGGYTSTYQTAAGSYLSLGTGSASATWTSVASYGIGVTFAAAGDQAIGYFSDDINGQVYRATWIAGSTGPSTGYGYIQVEQLV
jgi:hypothetical protein